MLGDARLGDKDIDNLYNDVCSLGLAAAYVADPPLVAPGALAAHSMIEGGPDGGGGRRDDAAMRSNEATAALAALHVGQALVRQGA